MRALTAAGPQKIGRRRVSWVRTRHSTGRCWVGLLGLVALVFYFSASTSRNTRANTAALKNDANIEISVASGHRRAASDQSELSMGKWTRIATGAAGLSRALGASPSLWRGRSLPALHLRLATETASSAPARPT